MCRFAPATGYDPVIVAQHHIAADRDCGRAWECACASCRIALRTEWHCDVCGCGGTGASLDMHTNCNGIARARK